MKLRHTDRYLDWCTDVTAPFVVDWLGVDAVRDNWMEELTDIASHIDDQAYGELFAHHCPCPAAAPLDYCPREISCGPGLSVVAGIHFDTEFFVHIYAMTRPVAAGEWPAVEAALAMELSMFAPASLRRFIATYEPHPPAVVDETRRLVGRIPDLLQPVESQPRLTLQELASPADVYDSYVAAYERYYQQHPEMRPIVTPETQTRLQQCAEHDALFQILVDGEAAGLIAALPRRYEGMFGWGILEEILDAPYRGQGLARFAQLEMLSRLDTSRWELAIGTISVLNPASMKTARRVGRLDAGGWITVSLEPHVRGLPDHR